MARSTLTSARSALTSARSSLTSARSAISCYRMPIDIVDMGITNLWDFRTGKTSQNSATVNDVIGNLPVFWRGTTALSSVYTANEYSADFERNNNDYFLSNQFLLGNTAASISFFSWVRIESTATGRHMLSQWETSGNNRSFLFRISTTDNLEAVLSSNGTLQAVYADSATFTDTTAWHFVLFTYDTTNRGQFYLDGVSRTTNLTTGSAPSSIYGAKDISLMIGAQTPSGPSGFFDGKIGICGMARNTALTAAQGLRLYDITRKFMGV